MYRSLLCNDNVPVFLLIKLCFPVKRREFPNLWTVYVYYLNGLQPSWKLRNNKLLVTCVCKSFFVSLPLFLPTYKRFWHLKLWRLYILAIELDYPKIYKYTGKNNSIYSICFNYMNFHATCFFLETWESKINRLHGSTLFWK